VTVSCSEKNIIGLLLAHLWLDRAATAAYRWGAASGKAGNFTLGGRASGRTSCNNMSCGGLTHSLKKEHSTSGTMGDMLPLGRSAGGDAEHQHTGAARRPAWAGWAVSSSGREARCVPARGMAQNSGSIQYLALSNQPPPPAWEEADEGHPHLCLSSREGYNKIWASQFLLSPSLAVKERKWACGPRLRGLTCAASWNYV